MKRDAGIFQGDTMPNLHRHGCDSDPRNRFYSLLLTRSSLFHDHSQSSLLLDDFGYGLGSR